MLFLRTVQATAFKAIFEVLKDVLHDVNVVFDKSGMRILTLDTAKASLIDLYLKAENFEEYEVQERLVAGVNMVNMFKLLKIIGNNDTMTMRITTPEFIQIVINNSDKKSVTEFKLNLLDINEDFFESPESPESQCQTIVHSADLQRICRDMGNLAKKVTISRHENKLTIWCRGDFAQQSTELEFEDAVECEMKGEYSLRYLNLFTKATGLSSNVIIRQHPTDTSGFLILNYQVANLGYMDFYLASSVEAEDA